MIDTRTEKAMVYQVLESKEADFEVGTWSFALSHDTRVGAGHYAILPSEEFMKLSGKLAHANGLLKRVLEVNWSEGIGGQLHEAIEAFFDPEPLG